MLINGLNTTRILIALVLMLLLNSFLYCPRAAHSFRKETRSVKALLLGLSKTLYYKVLLSLYSYYPIIMYKAHSTKINTSGEYCMFTPPRALMVQLVQSPT
jgi:hypothetical protein